MIDINIDEKSFGNGPVLENIRVKISQGEFITILGPSGCGKSTLLRCIGGFEKFTGFVTIRKKTICKPSRDILMIFQDFQQLYPWLTVKENVTFALDHVEGKQRANSDTALEFLETVGLKDFQDYFPNELSGGMKQRAAIARSLALKPKVLLMDEPFGSLDAQTRTILQRELLDLWIRFQTTIIFITHNIQESILLGDRIIVMSSEPGRILHVTKNTLERPRRPDKEGFRELWHELYSSLDQKRFAS